MTLPACRDRPDRLQDTQDLTRYDFELRSFTTALMNTVMVSATQQCSRHRRAWGHLLTPTFCVQKLQEAFLAWWPLVFWPADSPNFDRGFISCIIIGVLTIALVLIIMLLEKRM